MAEIENMNSKNISNCTVKRFYFLSILLLIVVANGALGHEKEILAITNVAHNRQAFDPSAGQTVIIDFEINKPASVEITIYDWLGRKIRTFNQPNLDAGNYSIDWDGNTDENKPAAGEVFLYVIKATGEDGQTAVYNRAAKTGGYNPKKTKYKLDKDTGKIEYFLSKTCMVRLHVGLDEGMLARSIFEWKPHTAGRYIHQWNGKDESGLMEILNYPDLRINFVCYTLPENSIIKTGKLVPFAVGDNLTREQKKQRNIIWATKGKYAHYQRDPLISHPIKFKVSFPDSDIKKEQVGDVPVVSGITKTRIEIDPADKQHLTNTRFELMVYVDGVFVHETEEGSILLTFDLDTRSLSKGPHVITFNILSYDHYSGILSRKVVVGD